MQSKIECVRIAFMPRSDSERSGGRYCKVPEREHGANERQVYGGGGVA